jgi:hypothetical protein
VSRPFYPGNFMVRPSTPMKPSDNPNRIAVLYGVFVAVGLIAYFWIAWFLGIVNIPEFRIINLFIQTAGIYFAYQQFRKTNSGSLNYFRALLIGAGTSAIGTSLFAVFLFVLFQADPVLFDAVLRHEPVRPYLTVYLTTFAVWLEGILSGGVATFVLTNVMPTDPR